MDDIPLFAKQPIFDADLNVVAHELLFRGVSTSGEAATADVILSAFDQSAFEGAADNLPVFINFPREILLNMPLLDKSKLVVEVLEDVEVTDELVQVIKALHEAGYRIALDDYLHDPAFEPLLPYADIIKLDVLETPAAELEQIVAELAPYDCELLAEKVENHEVYEHCRGLGVAYYQGYFFARPNIVHGRSVTADGATVLHLLAELQQPESTAQRLENIILSDTVLTYRIIKLVNSVAYRRVNEISSVAGAIAMLGMRQISAFATLISLSGAAEKPAELSRYSATRGYFCQHLGEQLQTPFAPESLFTLGVLSLSDAYFDRPINELTENLPLHPDFKAALLHREGMLGAMLDVAEAYQQGDWAAVDWEKITPHGITQALADTAHTTALSRRDETAAALRD